MAGGYKIGGTASAAGKGVLLFHGTILVGSDLERLVSVLAAHHPSYPGKLHSDPAARSVASVPSPVGNASWFRPGLGTQEVANALAEAAGNSVTLDWSSIIDSGTVDELAATYASSSWIYRTTQKGIS